MARLLKLYLLVTGIGATLSVLMPNLVVIGLFLILPGLILALMPTAFLWGCVGAAVWFGLSDRLGAAPAAAAALVVTATLLWLAPLPSRTISAARLAAAIQPDIVPPAPIALTGHVRIDMFASQREESDPVRRGAPRPVRCNALCAATLFTDGVETVTLNPLGYGPLEEAQAIGETPLAGDARTFRRVPRAQCAETLRPTGAAGLGADFAEAGAIEAEWNLRLSTRDCIVAEPTRTAHDLVIAHASYTVAGRTGGYGWDVGPRGVAVQRLELRVHDTVRLRRLIATTDALAQPLWIGAGGSLETFHFGWERRRLTNAPRFASLDAEAILRQSTTLAAHADPGAIARLVRERLQAMLADPSVTPTDPGWAAAETYFRSLRRGGMSDADRSLLPALIRERRMTRFDGIWDAIAGLGPEGVVLRDAMVDRLADPGPGDQAAAIRILGRAIANLPPGTFAQLTAAEQALLADPIARRGARGLVSRQADRGSAAVPLLLAIVDYHAQAWAVARATPSRGPGRLDSTDAILVDAARIAFCELGPLAAGALPTLTALEREPGLARLLSSDQDWMIALARLGRTVDSFAKPESLSGTPEQFHDHLQRRLQSFRPDRDCRSSYT